MIGNLESRSTTVNPIWWRVPAWAAITVVSVLQTHGDGRRVVAGLLIGGAAALFQLVEHRREGVRAFGVLCATVLGLGGSFASPGGLAEVLVVVAATRAPRGFSGVWLRAYTVATTIAFGATVGLVSHSLPGVLAGLGIPLLVQRSVEQQEIVRQRDRAQALLAEVQAGREAETQAAALRERGRIARDMHDVLAHSLAGLSVQLQGVRAVAAREGVGPAVLEPLDRAAQLAKDGLAEARDAVSTLRDPVGLGLGELPALIERHPGHATLTVRGEAATVTAEAGHAVYRAVQEALTNSARYAPGSQVSVVARWQSGTLVVDVANDGPAAGRSAVAGQGTGLGLAGMAERIGAAGGTVTSGPDGERGWRTHITVPATEEGT